MEKIFTWFNNVPDDKVRHAIGGVALFAIGNALDNEIGGIALCVFVAWLKEYCDSLHPEKHTCDFWDFVATCSGGMLGLFCTFKVI